MFSSSFFDPPVVEFALFYSYMLFLASLELREKGGTIRMRRRIATTGWKKQAKTLGRIFRTEKA